MDLGIAGYVAVVTGADSGIGLAVARQLLAEGAKVVISDQHEAELARAAADLRSEHVWHCTADVTKTADIKALAEAVADKFGVPRILVHCAGTECVNGLDTPLFISLTSYAV